MGAPPPPRPTPYGTRPKPVVDPARLVPLPRPVGPSVRTRAAALRRARLADAALAAAVWANSAPAPRSGARPPTSAPAPAAAEVIEPAVPIQISDTAIAAPEPAPRPTVDAAASPTDSPRRYLPGLDGLRAVSVLAVIAYHLGELSGGFLGVDVFFVISGFLITRLLFAERDRTGGIAMGSFWLRRFKRLVPALLLVLVAVAVGSRLWLPAWRLPAIRLDALAALSYVANWRFVLSGQSYFSSGIAPSPLRHTWSLAIEEQFYLLWPLLVVGLVRIARTHARRVVGGLAAAGAVASAAWMAMAAANGLDLSRIYYGTDTRAFALLAGAWLGTWWDPATERARARTNPRGRSTRWAVVGTVALVPLAVLLVVGTNDADGFYRWGFQAAAVLSTLAVAGLATGVGPAARVLGTRALVWLGRRSYGIYLWSWPTQVFASEYFDLEGLTLDAVVVVLAIVLAALSFWLIEEPVRTGARPTGFGARSRADAVPRRSAARVGLSVASVLAVVAVVVGTSAGAPEAPAYTTVSDKEALAAAISPMSDAERERLLQVTTTTQRPVEQVPGPFTGAPTMVVDPDAVADPSARLGRPMKVMIAGDSVGWSLGFRIPPTLTVSVQLDDKALIGCGMMPWTSSFIVGKRDPEQYPNICVDAELAELQGLERQPDVALLWVGAWEVYDHEIDGTRFNVGTAPAAAVIEARIQERVDRFQAKGVPTVIPLVTCFGPNAMRLGKERHDEDRISWINARLRAVAKRNRGWVRLIAPQQVLCNPDGTAVEETTAGDALRQDGAHFTAETAAWFWNTWLAGQMGAAFELPAGADASATATASTEPGASTTSTAPPEGQAAGG